MPSRHAVPLTPSVFQHLSQLPRCEQNEQSNFHCPYTLPSSVSRKSCICHSYENTGGVGVFFPFWNSSLPTRRTSLATVFKSFLFTSWRTLLHFFALMQNSTLFLSSPSTLFAQKTPRWGCPSHAMNPNPKSRFARSEGSTD